MFIKLYISNFMLDLYNLITYSMKKTVVVFVVAGLVMVTSVLWFFQSETRFDLLDLLQFGIIILVVGFALFVGYKRLTSVKRGEPAEDELSKKVMQKTAAWSFYISLYLWLAVMYMSDKADLETHTIIGMGILGMAVTFAITWIIINFRGIRNE